MLNLYRAPYRQFTLDTIFEAEAEAPPVKFLWRSVDLLPDGRVNPEHEEFCRVASNAINIVAGKDIEQNLRMSIRMAVEMAKAGYSVTYVNAYAGLTKFCEVLRAEMARAEEKESGVLQAAPKCDCEECRKAAEESNPTPPPFQGGGWGVVEPEQQSISD